MATKGSSSRRGSDGSWQPPVKKLIQDYLMRHPRWVNSTELRVKLGLGQRTVHWAATELVEEGELEVKIGAPRQPAQYRYIRDD